MPFEPANKDHAIVSIVIGIKLNKMLGEVEIGLIENAHQQNFLELLPAKQIVDAMQFAPSDTNPARAKLRRSIGIEFAAVMRDGTPEWHVVVSGDEITVTCRRYTRWALVWERVATFFRHVLLALAAKDFSFVGATYQMIDEFRWHGEPKEYNLKQLLDENSPVINKGTFTREVFWHLHQGWFEDVPTGRLLTQLNFDGMLNGEHPQPVVRLTSNRVLTESEPTTLSSLKDEYLKRIFEDLHLRDKATLNSVLTPEIQTRIALNSPAVAS